MYKINQSVTITRVTGQSETGRIVAFKKQRANDFKMHWYMLLDFGNEIKDWFDVKTLKEVI